MSKTLTNWISALLSSSILLAIGYFVVQLLPKDHPVEQKIEDAIEDSIEGATGVKVEIDLTP